MGENECVREKWALKSEPTVPLKKIVALFHSQNGTTQYLQPLQSVHRSSGYDLSRIFNGPISTHYSFLAFKNKGNKRITNQHLVGPFLHSLENT